MKQSKPPEAEGLSASHWKDRRKPTLGQFPGPAGADVPLRVAFSRAAYGAVMAHAHGSLEDEVCGVLVGRVCEDDEGLFLDVRQSLRGAGAREGRGHVTFTQETWNAIHATLEKEHPEEQIVGWYHTHPGFGVEFSEMDSFIHRHFFSGPSQVALVVDPLRGETALAINQGGSLQYLDRFWVDAREHRARGATSGGHDPGLATVSEALVSLEARVGRLHGAVAELRASLRRFLLLAGATAALAIAVVVTYSTYRAWIGSLKPPEHIAFVPVPVTIDGEPALIGFSVVTWKIPPELLAVREEPASPSPSPPAESQPAKEQP